MTRSPLHPEKRMDRNGKLVTRHVRDDPAGTRSERQLPAPAVAPTPAPVFDSAEALVAIRHLTVGWRGADSLVRGHADGLISDATLAAVLDVASADPGSRWLLKEYLDSALQRSRDESDACLHAAVRSIHMAAVLHSHWRSMRGAAVMDLNNAGSKSGMSDYRGEPEEGHVGLFKAYLFAERVGLYPEAYQLKHDYYRAMEQLRQRIDVIEANLPPLAAALPQQFSHYGVSTDEYGEASGLTWEDVRSALDAVQSSGIDPQEIVDFMAARETADLHEAIALMGQSTAPLREGLL